MSCSNINISQLEQPVGHGCGTDTGPEKPWHHGGKIVSPVEAIFEFREIARHMLLVDRSISSNDGGFDIPKCRIDPFEARDTGRRSARTGLDDLVGTPGLGYGAETHQAIADDRAGWIEAAFGKDRN